MKLVIKPVFEVEVHLSEYYQDEKLTKAEKISRIKEEWSDYSVFSPGCGYGDLKDVSVEIKD
jgi:uncharacterized protein YutD